MPDLRDQLQAMLGSRYVLEGEVGAGGMARVYAAQDAQYGRRVAVKVLRPECAAELGSERFLREIAIAARLQHPHIVPIYDSGGADALLYYTMPFVAGETLRQRLERERVLPVSEGHSCAPPSAARRWGRVRHHSGVTHAPPHRWRSRLTLVRACAFRHQSDVHSRSRQSAALAPTSHPRHRPVRAHTRAADGHGQTDPAARAWATMTHPLLADVP